MNLYGILLTFAGAFSLAGAICDWEWFMNSRKAGFMVKLLTRTGARIFYGILGLLLCAGGLLVVFGFLQ